MSPPVVALALIGIGCVLITTSILLPVLQKEIEEFREGIRERKREKEWATSSAVPSQSGRSGLVSRRAGGHREGGGKDQGRNIHELNDRVAFLDANPFALDSDHNSPPSSASRATVPRSSSSSGSTAPLFSPPTSPKFISRPSTPNWDFVEPLELDDGWSSSRASTPQRGGDGLTGMGALSESGDWDLVRNDHKKFD